MHNVPRIFTPIRSLWITLPKVIFDKMISRHFSIITVVRITISVTLRTTVLTWLLTDTFSTKTIFLNLVKIRKQLTLGLHLPLLKAYFDNAYKDLYVDHLNRMNLQLSLCIHPLHYKMLLRYVVWSHSDLHLCNLRGSFGRPVFGIMNPNLRWICYISHAAKVGFKKIIILSLKKNWIKGAAVSFVDSVIIACWFLKRSWGI